MRGAILVLALLVGGPIVQALPADGAERPRPLLTGLNFPTNLAVAPDGRIFFGEKETGQIRVVKDGVLLPQPFATLAVEGDAERGLLGLALDPGFPQRPWVYVYFSDATDGHNRLVRIRADGNVGGAPQTLLRALDASPGYHNGGDIAFGTDGSLFLSIGEGHAERRAQRLTSLGGKIVRLASDGSVPDDDPFTEPGDPNPVYSYGHRNSFGLCVDPANGNLWETENGPDVDDEINLIRRGMNYGWPLVTGRGQRQGLVDPVAVFHDTIAVTGCAVMDDVLYIGSYNDGVVRAMSAASGAAPPTIVARFPSGVTDVERGPGSTLYVATDDAIWTLGGTVSIATRSSVTTSPTATVVTPSPPRGSDIRRWIAWAALLVLGVGLGLRFTAGRRLRRDTRLPPPPTPPVA